MPHYYRRVQRALLLLYRVIRPFLMTVACVLNAGGRVEVGNIKSRETTDIGRRDEAGRGGGRGRRVGMPQATSIERR